MSDTDEDSNSSESSDAWPVTEEWLSIILRQYHQTAVADTTISNEPSKKCDVIINSDNDKIQILEFDVRPGCEAGESVLSDILSVHVEYVIQRGEDSRQDDGGDEAKRKCLNLIVKLLPQDPFSRFFVTEAQFDLREIKFYTQVVPDLQKFQKANLVDPSKLIDLPIPKCYHAHYSAGSNEPDCSPIPPESVLVLENIKPCGYSSADFSRGLTLRQTSSALEAIAKLHALSLSLKYKEKKSLSERYSFLFQTARATDSYQQLVERGLPQLSRFLERRPGLEDVIEALSKIRSNTKELIASLLAPEEPMALITHTDFWCNNLMFCTDSGEETKCAILDWQMVTYSRPTNDIALLLISSVPSELRRLHTDTLLSTYWDSLTTTAKLLGVDIESDLGYSRLRLKSDYQRSQLLALLLCIGSVDVALGDPLTEQRLLDVLQDLYTDGVLTADISAQGDCLKAQK